MSPHWVRHGWVLVVLLGVALSMSTLALAADSEDPLWFTPHLPPAPAAVPPVPGECPRAFDLVAGQPLPAGLVTPDGLARCTATVIPVSQGLSVMSWAEHGRTMRTVYQADTSVLIADRGWALRRVAQLEKPPKWWERPSVQQASGGAKVLIAVGIAIAVLRVSTEANP